MQPRSGLKKIQSFFEAIKSKCILNRSFIVLSLFLLAVLLVSFIFPVINFGRFLGTDDYTHLFHTKEMAVSTGISDFYENIGTKVSDPTNVENLYNYPFGVWLFGATLAKITGLPVMSAEFIFIILFLCVLIASFYVYSRIFLESKEQQIIAVLFLLSMPNAATSLLSFRPSIFILPFLFILLYLTLKEPFEWKLLPIVWLSIFVITLSHTGSFIFLISFSILFFLLYCLLWGRFSLSMFSVILSTFVIYILSIKWFPQIANQYEVKSTLFLSPGNFLASKFNFSFLLDLGNIFYQNMIVNQEFIYTLILAGFIFTVGELFLYIHRKVSEKYFHPERVYAFSLPISNISHTVGAVPLWLGPIHILFSVIGFFRINPVGKCMLISGLLVTILPDMLFESSSSTGALREVSYLAIIIPITTALGFWALISYLDTIKNPQRNFISLMVWVLVLMAIIITPILATTYYMPRISGEDYVIDGMKWLGNTGDLHEKVVGYGYRPVPIYTNMTDAGYSVQSGYDTRNFVKLLKGIYFSSGGTNVENFRHQYGVKYILASDKMAGSLGGTPNQLVMDKNPALDKTYASKDFGVYEVLKSSGSEVEKKFIIDNISYQRTGSAIEVETDTYKIVLNENYPTIERFGTVQDNYFGEGFSSDRIQISGFRSQEYINPFLPRNESTPIQSSTVDQFSLDSVPIPAEMSNNQIIYRTILKDQVNGNNETTLLVRYSFYPKTVKREFLFSNDWVTSPYAQYMNVKFTTSWFIPLNDFLVKSNQTVLLKRHIYPSEDSTAKSEIVPEFYIHSGKRGIYIMNEPTSPYPSEISYKGSTLYDYSSIGLGELASVKPGDTLHITQFLSVGDEESARKNILTQEGIALNNYPDGIVPIMVSGYRTPDSDIGENKSISQGYQVMRNASLPYSEIVVPRQENRTIDITAIKQNNIKLIGSGSTISGIFNNFSVQQNSVLSLLGYARQEGIPLIGYMPESLNYNLDTVKAISESNISFMLSRSVSPSAYGDLASRDRNLRMATYHGETLDIPLLPVSYPTSNGLSYGSDNAIPVALWKTTIDNAMEDDGMVFFVFRSAEIGNPAFTENFTQIFSYAQDKGLTFTTPDVIANHFKDLQKIQYQGSIDNDMASINLTNNNDHAVSHVSFTIVLPSLKSGGYKISNGELVRTKKENNQVILYVSTDVPAHSSQEIVIEPDTPRQKIVTSFPVPLTEGTIIFSVKDADGKPLKNMDITIDSTYYYADKEGKVTVDLKRGMHTIKIQSPGYETYSSPLDVKGRIELIKHYFGNISPFS